MSECACPAATCWQAHLASHHVVCAAHSLPCSCALRLPARPQQGARGGDADALRVQVAGGGRPHGPQRVQVGCAQRSRRTGACRRPSVPLSRRPVQARAGALTGHSSFPHPNLSRPGCRAIAVPMTGEEGVSPATGAGRVLFIALALFSIIVVALYTASLTIVLFEQSRPVATISRCVCTAARLSAPQLAPACVATSRQCRHADCGCHPQPAPPRSIDDFVNTGQTACIRGTSTAPLEFMKANYPRVSLVIVNGTEPVSLLMSTCPGRPAAQRRIHILPAPCMCTNRCTAAAGTHPPACLAPWADAGDGPGCDGGRVRWRRLHRCPFPPPARHRRLHLPRAPGRQHAVLWVRAWRGKAGS